VFHFSFSAYVMPKRWACGAPKRIDTVTKVTGKAVSVRKGSEASNGEGKQCAMFSLF
jgi:hypothetical protein